MPPVLYHDGRFPPPELDWPRLIPHIGPAAAAVARYDGLLVAIPSADVLLSPLTTQEAVLSSRIEGTQATMGEVLEYEAGRKPASDARKEDIHEVLNYRAAMREAEKMLHTLPLSQHVVKKAHEILLSGVRGAGKSPGEYRRVPNWIFEHPIFNSSAFIASSGIPPASARRVLKILTGRDVIRRVIPGRGRRAAYYAFPELLNRAEGEGRVVF